MLPGWSRPDSVRGLFGLYKPLRDYDAKTLGWDLSGHLAYGASTGAAFWLLAKIL